MKLIVKESEMKGRYTCIGMDTNNNFYLRMGEDEFVDVRRLCEVIEKLYKLKTIKNGRQNITTD